MAKTFNIENLVINRPVRGTMFDKSTGEVIFSVDKIQDAQLECSGEQVFVNDNLGQKIAAFDRAKDAKFTGASSLINFGLMAAQLGSDKAIATDSKKLVMPAFDLLETADGTSIELSFTPHGEVKYIYSTHADKTKDAMYASAMSKDATHFKITGKKIELPDGVFKKGDRIAVWYERETTKGIEIKNTTDKFAKGGRFVLEALCADVCDPTKEYYCYIIFNNSKMDNSVNLAISNETKQNFSIQAMQDYCSTLNELFTICVAGE